MSKRHTALDALRALAVLMVLGRHAPMPGPEQPGWLRAGMEPWINAGWAGVDLFFVISGFLVSGLLFRELRDTGTASTGRFLVRRGFKIYPAFYVMLAFTLAYRGVRGIHEPRSKVFGELFFFQSYVPGVWNHTWSLAVEEHFYLLLALSFALFTGRSKPQPRWAQVLVAYGVVAATCLGFRLALVEQPYGHMTHLFATHLRLDSLAFGLLLAYLHCYHEHALRSFVVRFRPVLAVFGGALFGIPLLLPLGANRFLTSCGLTLIAWGAGAILLLALHAKAPDHWYLRGPARLGADSYSVYLWHMPVLHWLVLPLLAKLGFAGGSYLWLLVSYLVASIAVGVAAARCVELPLLRIRERYFPSRTVASKAPVVVAGLAEEQTLALSQSGTP